MVFSHFREKAADHQKDVDGHLMFSYMSEAQGWKKELERLERGKIKKPALFLGDSANGLFPFP
jgi:hypothetical protein